jgi:hypothetical protein
MKERLTLDQIAAQLSAASKELNQEQRKIFDFDALMATLHKPVGALEERTK